jgi:hypothetical protein
MSYRHLWRFLDVGRGGDLLADRPHLLGADYFAAGRLAASRVAALGA